MIDLKRCPVCGKNDMVELISGEDEWGWCNRCGIWDWAGLHAIKNWNTRPLEDALEKRVQERDAHIESLKFWLDIAVNGTKTAGGVTYSIHKNDDGTFWFCEGER